MMPRRTPGRSLRLLGKYRPIHSGLATLNDQDLHEYLGKEIYDQLSAYQTKYKGMMKNIIDKIYQDSNMPSFVDMNRELNVVIRCQMLSENYIHMFQISKEDARIWRKALLALTKSLEQPWTDIIIEGVLEKIFGLNMKQEEVFMILFMINKKSL